MTVAGFAQTTHVDFTTRSGPLGLAATRESTATPIESTATKCGTHESSFPSLVGVRLTKGTDLALRIMMRLAVLDDSTAVTTKDVAGAVDVPAGHAAKIVSRLRELGVLEVRRGRHGGLTLTPEGHTGSLGALVRNLEGEGDVAACTEGTPCPLRHACRLREALKQAREAFFASLDPLTIDELTHEPTEQVLLSLSPART